LEEQEEEQLGKEIKEEDYICAAVQKGLKAGTFGSCIRGETPDEILSRIAYGWFGAHVNANGGSNDAPMNATNNNGGGLVNATTSGGGNYSPPQDDDFLLFWSHLFSRYATYAFWRIKHLFHVQTFILMPWISDIRMDEVTQAVENLKKEWSQAVSQLEESIAAIKSCGKSGKGTEEANSLPRLNGSAQDALQLLKSLQFRLDLLAQQLPTFEEVQSGQATLESWDEQYKK
jgi:hypothetical protein